jgi:N-acetylglucosamine malate deacetylase 1
MPVDLLAAAAHPDDVEIGCSGTLVMARRAGRSFGIVDLTRGEMGTRGDTQTRGREAARAAEILGASFRETLDFGDGGLRTGRPEELALADLIRRERPRVVLAPYPEDRHPDHARAGRLITDAAFYAGLEKLQTSHPAHRPQQVLYFSTFIPHRPHFVVDVTPAMETRREALGAFASQFHDPGSREPDTVLSQPAFLESVEARLRYHGAMIGVAFGEGFRSLRPPKIADLLAAFEGFEPAF